MDGTGRIQGPETAQTQNAAETTVVKQSRWKGHGMSVLKGGFAVITGIALLVFSPALLVVGGIGAGILATSQKARDRAYSFALNHILLDSRAPKNSSVKSSQIVPTDPEGDLQRRALQVAQNRDGAEKSQNDVKNSTTGFSGVSDDGTISRSWGFFVDHPDAEIDPSTFESGKIFTQAETEEIREFVSETLQQQGVDPKKLEEHTNKIVESVTRKKADEIDETAPPSNDPMIRHLQAKKQRQAKAAGRAKAAEDLEKVKNERVQALSKLLPAKITSSIDEDRASVFEHTTIQTPDGALLDGCMIKNRKQQDTPIESQNWIVFHVSKGATYESQLNMLYRMSQATDANILVYNYRGVGSSEDSEDHPILTDKVLVDDGDAVAQHLLNQGVKSRNMMMMGHSQGGAIATQVAARHQEEDDSMHLAVMHTYRTYAEAASQLVPIPFLGRIFANAIKSRWEFNTVDYLPLIKGHVITVENPEDRIVKTRLRVNSAVGAHFTMTTQPAKQGPSFFSRLMFGEQGQAAHNVTIYSYNYYDQPTIDAFTEEIHDAFIPPVPTEDPPEPGSPPLPRTPAPPLGASGGPPPLPPLPTTPE